MAGPVLTASGLITIGAGTYLVLRLRWNSLDSWFDTRWGWAILLGFIVAVAAMGTGGSLALVSRRMAGLGMEIGEGPPTPEQAAQIQSLTSRLTLLGRATAVLVGIGVGSMASARFV